MASDETLKISLVEEHVANALAEDLGSGDITAALIPDDQYIVAQIIAREDFVCCGQAWVEGSFTAMDPESECHWFVEDGEAGKAGSVVMDIKGKARGLLSAERTALNFLQTLSSTATQTRAFTSKLGPFECQLLDTRKTLPGFRYAQKYAVRCGGGNNHRMGLYDVYLIKENHITACGSINKAIETARKQAPDKPVVIEVESLEQLRQTLESHPDRIMLDNFTLQMMQDAVPIAKRCGIPLEVSGNVSLDTVEAIASTGVDFVSVGSITKNIKAIDFTMLVKEIIP